jgi:hypothetical protein
MTHTRRAILKRLGAAAVAPVHVVQRRASAESAIDAVMLSAIADAVLPESLTAAARQRVTTDFQRWIREYRPGAEMDHGYGFTRLRTTGPSPAAKYGEQIALLSRAAGDSVFAKLPIAARRDLIARALADASVERLPARPTGAHIASDLMAFYFNSSDAFDRCYGATIGRDQCRGLPGSENPPPRLTTND